MCIPTPCRLGRRALVRERTGGLLTFSASRAGALLVAAARSAPPDVVEQTRADRAAAEECLEGRFGPFLREHIAAGHRVGEIVEALAAASGGALILTAARVGRLIEDERDRGGPYQKPPKSTRPAAEQPPQPARRKKAPRTRDGARSSGTPAKRPSSVEHSTDPHQPSPRSAPRRLRQLANDLERALRTDPYEFVMKHARIAKSKGIQDPKVAAEVLEVLRSRGAPPTMTVDDVRLFLREAGWRTGKDRARDAEARRAEAKEQAMERAWRAARDREIREEAARRDRQTGFWAGIATERYVRPVGGGLPGLGRRR